ncbi:MAG: LCP family protein [bacterium]
MKALRRFVSAGTAAIVLVLTATYATAGPSRLTVQTNPPGAVLYLDGENTGFKTPVRLTVRPGKHRLRLVKSGYHPLQRMVEVYSNVGFANFNLKPIKKSKEPSQARPASYKAQADALDRTKNRTGSPAEGPRKTKRYYPERNVKVLKRGSSQRAPERKRPAARTMNVLPENNPFREWMQENEKEEKQEQTRSRQPAPEGKNRAPKKGFFPLIKEQEDKQTSGKHEKAVVVEGEDENNRSSGPKRDAIKERGVIKIKETTKEVSSESATSRKPEKDPVPADREEPDSRGQPRPTKRDRNGPLACAPAPEGEWPRSAEAVLHASAQGLPRFPEKFNVLLLGLDRRDRKGILATGAKIPLKKLRRKPANSDVIMVFQVDFRENRIRVVSIPRDTRVYIPGHGYRKINAAYAYGRDRLSRKIVESFLDIEIHRTVTADYRGAKKSIAMFKRLGLDYHGYSEKEMFWHLRKRSFPRGDLRRIERQQAFMKSALKKLLRLYNDTRQAKGTSALVKNNLMDMAIRKGLDEIITDFTEQEIHILAYALRDFDFDNMVMGQVRGRGGRRHGRYFYLPYRNHTFDDVVARLE